MTGQWTDIGGGDLLLESDFKKREEGFYIWIEIVSSQIWEFEEISNLLPPMEYNR